jgi:hypothetical protein
MANGQDGRAAKTMENITLPGGGSVAEKGRMSEGEGFPVGTRYNAILHQRERKLGGRNEGMDLGQPSANPSVLPSVDQGSRKTGRL